MTVFNPPINKSVTGDAATLNGKSEAQLDVSNAATLGGKSEDQLVVLEAGNAVTFGGYSVDHFMASDYSEFTALTAQTINIEESESGSSNFTYTSLTELLDLSTGSGLGHHNANLMIGELTLDGNQFTSDGNPRIKFGVNNAIQEVDDSILIGGTSNYAAFATDGTFTLVGTARTWEDLRIEPNVRVTSPTTYNPTFEQWFTNGSASRGVYLYSFEDGSTEKEIHFTMQMPHQWAGTAINIHVHWIPYAASTAEVVKWGLEYTWAEPGATFGNTALVYATTTVQGDANYVQYKHYITQFTSISPSSTTDGLSTIMIGRLFRNSNDAADTYASKAGLLYIDAHYEVDSMGSSTEYIK